MSIRPVQYYEIKSEPLNLVFFSYSSGQQVNSFERNPNHVRYSLDVYM